ncbi:nucleotidyltransferase domain-containing protein [Duganella levis]|uniref:Cyclic GMP-AMP synthase n=1 Tax=Duganella levis TaxID=2692169 RepID=A0ABW9W5L4_9BURK|nr:nucleotidyltransferase [Duganella levis]MYN29206.1 nucleotidyltransferase [Duganella levis]
MPAVQKNFEDFHFKIKLDEDDEKATLREKRDTLLRALEKNLADDVPEFANFHQGSYSMHTGVIPLDGNFDIDVGLIFDCKRDKYPDPVVLKKKIRDALDTHGRSVNIRRPCVTVNYMRGDEIAYHVDLAVYTKRDDGFLDLAKGKENSASDKRVWEPSDPKKLTELICTAFSDKDELAQYRRCIRYLKRWRQVQFLSGAPLSIALTVAAQQWFQPYFEMSGKAGDLQAMLNWVNAILTQFHWASANGSTYQRLAVTLPVVPYSDLMGWMSEGQMSTVKAKFEVLRDALEEALDEDLPEDACKVLNKQFGAEFVVPEKAATARAVVPPVISTGNSA